MSRYTLTENEARVLRAMNDYPRVSIYEISSFAQLTPSEVDSIAKVLAHKGLFIYDEVDAVVEITAEGRRAQQSLISEPSAVKRARPGSEVAVVSEDEALSASALSEMSDEELNNALSEEMGRLESLEGAGE
jgi:DNA-binding MarR family transcriptional regulator